MSTNKVETIMNEQEKTQLSEYATQLSQLQEEIQSNETLSVNHAKAALELAVKAGGILNDAKKLFQYGKWEAWLKANVKGITDRTAQNYMKLAKRVSVLGDCQSLGEAYLAIGVKKKAPPKKGASEQGKGGAVTPEEANEQDNAEYRTKLTEANSLIVQRARGEIENAGVNWNVKTWAVKGGKPASDDATNRFANMVHKLTHYIFFRDYTNLKGEDEVRAKTKAVLTELLNTIIKANRPPQPEVSESVAGYAFEVNPQPVEAAEKIAA